jgi:alkaline phosphatase D
MKSILVFLVIIFPAIAYSQIAAGPMIGHTSMTEVTIWVQFQSEKKATLWYGPQGSDTILHTPGIAPDLNDLLIVKFVLSDLQPGTTYTYSLQQSDETTPVFQSESYTFNTQELWQWRTDPPTFTLATGSCAYINEERFDRPGKPYGGDYYIFESIAKARPDMMLWLGDNTYLREADYGSRSGIMHRYSHTRSLKELQPLLSCCPNYAIWDDHDFGPNDSDRSFANKAWTNEAFDLFWANPSSGIPAVGGTGTSFTFNDIDFFLLDNRSFRTHPEIQGERQIWGKAQCDWLIEALKFSDASFKIVASGGQFLSDAPLYENHVRWQEERDYVIKRLSDEGIKNVIFLTGDRHHSELSALKLASEHMVYDLTASPLTSTAYDHTKEPNTLRVPGSIFGQRNYALLRFEGSKKTRKVVIGLFDSSGKELWEYKIERE